MNVTFQFYIPFVLPMTKLISSEYRKLLLINISQKESQFTLNFSNHIKSLEKTLSTAWIGTLNTNYTRQA